MNLKPKYLRTTAVLMALAWTGTLAISYLTGKAVQERHTLAVASAEAEAYFRLDFTSRTWAAGHGGVPVPASEQISPGPYPDPASNRETLQPAGHQTTQMNPAYIVRQLNEQLAPVNRPTARITSLNPLCPENGPDSWEVNALHQLENGAVLVQQVMGSGADEQLNLMRPLLTQEACLKCHADQGYREGDLRGGIAVTIPLARLRTMEHAEVARQLLVHLGLWVLGLACLGGGFFMLGRGLAEQQELAEQLRAALSDTEAIIDKVPVGVLIIGRDKVVRRANSKALEILGRTSEQVVGQVCHQNICITEVGQCPVLDLHQTLENSPRAFLGTMGHKVPILKTVIPFNWQGEDVLLEAFIDTTEQQRNNEKLMATVDELQRFNSLATGRELRMAELKQEVNALLAELEQAPRYGGQTCTVPGGEA